MRAPSLEAIWKALSEIDGFDEGSSIFSEDDADRAFFVDGTQVANIVKGHTIALRLTRKQISAHRDRLVADSHVERRSRNSDWIGIRIDQHTDLALLHELARIVAEVHRPPPGVPPKPPPSGTELARRRRFH
jgi:hypothetical protein